MNHRHHRSVLAVLLIGAVVVGAAFDPVVIAPQPDTCRLAVNDYGGDDVELDYNCRDEMVFYKNKMRAEYENGNDFITLFPASKKSFMASMLRGDIHQCFDGRQFSAVELTIRPRAGRDNDPTNIAITIVSKESRCGDYSPDEPVVFATACFVANFNEKGVMDVEFDKFEGKLNPGNMMSIDIGGLSSPLDIYSIKLKGNCATSSATAPVYQPEYGHEDEESDRYDAEHNHEAEKGDEEYKPTPSDGGYSRRNDDDEKSEGYSKPTPSKGYSEHDDDEYEKEENYKPAPSDSYGKHDDDEGSEGKGENDKPANSDGYGNRNEDDGDESGGEEYYEPTSTSKDEYSKRNDDDDDSEKEYYKPAPNNNNSGRDDDEEEHYRPTSEDDYYNRDDDDDELDEIDYQRPSPHSSDDDDYESESDESSTTSHSRSDDNYERDDSHNDKSDSPAPVANRSRSNVSPKPVPAAGASAPNPINGATNPPAANDHCRKVVVDDFANTNMNKLGGITSDDGTMGSFRIADNKATCSTKADTSSYADHEYFYSAIPTCLDVGAFDHLHVRLTAPSNFSMIVNIKYGDSCAESAKQTTSAAVSTATVTGAAFDPTRPTDLYIPLAAFTALDTRFVKSVVFGHFQGASPQIDFTVSAIAFVSRSCGDATSPRSCSFTLNGAHRSTDATTPNAIGGACGDGGSMAQRAIVVGDRLKLTSRGRGSYWSTSGSSRCHVLAPAMRWLTIEVQAEKGFDMKVDLVQARDCRRDDGDVVVDSVRAGDYAKFGNGSSVVHVAIPLTAFHHYNNSFHSVRIGDFVNTVTNSSTNVSMVVGSVGFTSGACNADTTGNKKSETTIANMTEKIHNRTNAPFPNVVYSADIRSSWTAIAAIATILAMIVVAL